MNMIRLKHLAFVLTSLFIICSAACTNRSQTKVLDSDTLTESVTDSLRNDTITLFGVKTTRDRQSVIRDLAAHDIIKVDSVFF